jgi:two-component system, OmpR family, sensor histidine kinase KdpD
MRLRWFHWLLWAGGIAATTLSLLAFRGRLDKAHVALVYLLLVLAGSIVGGRRLGLVLAAVAFLLFNWFFLPPYGTLVIADPLDWLVLIAFLVISTVAAQMLHWLQAEAEDARRRADEVDRLATLGAETLNVARADEALVAITEMIRSTLHVSVCRLHAAPPGGPAAPADDLIAWVLESGRPAMRLDDGTTRVSDTGTAGAEHGGVRSLLLPLNVRGRTVGVLELDSEQPFSLDAAQHRFLAALAYYAALGVERVRLEAEAGHAEALREADRLKNALLASVSHDLRTPLTTIKALAYELAERGDERVLAIGEEADRMNRLVADLLDLSGLQGGALKMRIELNAVDDLLGAVVQRVSGALGGRELRVALPDGGTFLVGLFDFKHAMRILVNLIENAHKYAPPGSAVDLGVQAVDHQLLFSVEDRGPGIALSERERIFEPFYRPPGTPPDVGGTGLGLAIARQLAEAQGGSLTYAPRPGGGSCFTLALPAAELPVAGESL